MDNQKKQQSFSIKPEIAAGKYSNLAIITHSRNEFILDFAAIFPGFAAPEVQSRIIMSPEHARRLLAALADNVHKYEEAFGTITMPESGAGRTINLSEIPFNGTKS